MRSRKDNEEYFKSERRKKSELVELYKQQDQELIDAMTRDFKVRYAMSVGIIAIAILIVALAFIAHFI